MRESTLTRSLVAMLLAALAVGPGLWPPAVALAQTQSATPPPPVFGAQTAAVVVDVVVRRLREKIDSLFDKKVLHTVRGMGYVVEER